MKRMFMLMTALGIMFSVTSSLPAWAYIIETGTPTGPFSSSTVISKNQFLAGEFTINQAETIGSIEIFTDSVWGGDFRIAIYDDDAVAGETPGTLRYSSIYPLVTNFSYDWRGVFGLNWVLNPGTYWVSFEVPEYSSGETGSLNPWIQFGGKKPENPLGNEAWWGSSNNRWFELDDQDMGVRIGGPQVVPLPGAVWLLGSGLLSLAGWRRFKKN
jgi:hypothetical protein